MPIMAAYDRSDARGAARLLATMALDCIHNPQIGSEQEVALNNVYRLLESYRSDVFFGLEQPRQPLRSGADKLTLAAPTERHVKAVRDALELARTEVFADQSKDRAIAFIEKVLRAIAYPKLNKAQKLSQIDKERTALFFKKLVENL